MLDRVCCIQLCVGDITVLGEVAGELLAEGIFEGIACNPGLVVDAVESVVSLNGGVKKFQKNCNNFAKFSVRVGRVCTPNPNE